MGARPPVLVQDESRAAVRRLSRTAVGHSSLLPIRSVTPLRAGSQQAQLSGCALRGGSEDRIEREIMIDAPVERVWRLVSEPGWWIGDADHSGQVTSRAADLVVVDFPPYGRFPVLTVSSDAPRHIAYRSSDSDQPLEEGTCTLVEFFLTEQDGGTLLRVVESGFAALAKSAEERAAAVEDNIDGWEQQLGSWTLSSMRAAPARRPLPVASRCPGRRWSSTCRSSTLPAWSRGSGLAERCCTSLAPIHWRHPRVGSPTCPPPGTAGSTPSNRSPRQGLPVTLPATSRMDPSQSCWPSRPGDADAHEQVAELKRQLGKEILA